MYVAIVDVRIIVDLIIIFASFVTTRLCCVDLATTFTLLHRVTMGWGNIVRSVEKGLLS